MDFDAAYREIARRHNITVEELRSEMQKAIEASFAIAKAQGVPPPMAKVPCRGEMLTPEELMRYLLKKVPDGADRPCRCGGACGRGNRRCEK